MDIQFMLEQALARIKATREAWGLAEIKTQEALDEIKKAKLLTEGIDKPTVDRTAKLTPKEKEIFLLLGKGLTTKEIGKELRRSQKTIEAHRETMRRKLGHASSYDLVKEAKSLL